jgi:hypothetical protein
VESTCRCHPFTTFPPTPSHDTTPHHTDSPLAALDPKTGLIYYFNEFTHETKWLPPETGDVLELKPDVLAAAAPSGRDSITPVSKPAWQQAGDEEEEEEGVGGGEDSEEEEEAESTVADETPGKTVSSLVNLRTPYAANSPLLFSPAGAKMKKPGPPSDPPPNP